LLLESHSHYRFSERFQSRKVFIADATGWESKLIKSKFLGIRFRREIDVEIGLPVWVTRKADEPQGEYMLLCLFSW
jgi:hypothetical protein